MGLIVEIMRGTYDSDLNAFTGKAEVTVVNIDGPFAPTPDRPAAVLVDAVAGPGKILVPALPDGNGGWVEYPRSGPDGPRMMGGTYAATSDSRWAAATGSRSAVPVHDRIESWALYNAMSRD